MQRVYSTNLAGAIISPCNLKDAMLLSLVAGVEKCRSERDGYATNIKKCNEVEMICNVSHSHGACYR